MNTTKMLGSLLTTVTLLCSAAFAEDTLKVGIDNDGKQVVAFTLHGKTSCVLVDDKVFCAPATAPKPVRLASSDSN